MCILKKAKNNSTEVHSCDLCVHKLYQCNILQKKKKEKKERKITKFCINPSNKWRGLCISIIMKNTRTVAPRSELGTHKLNE